MFYTKFLMRTVITLILGSLAYGQGPIDSVANDLRDEAKAESSETQDAAEKDDLTPQSLPELQKGIREVNQKINARKRAFYKENEEIKDYQKQINELQRKIKAIINSDAEYVKLMEDESEIRKKLQEHYRKRRADRDRPARSSEVIPEGSNNGARPVRPSEVVPEGSIRRIQQSAPQFGTTLD